MAESKLTNGQALWLRRIVDGEADGRGPLNTVFLSDETWADLTALKNAGLATGVIMFSSTEAGRTALQLQGGAEQ